MLFQYFNINEINDIVVDKYYPMLSDKRKSVISSMSSGHDRAVALCCEMLARKLLCRLLDAPEFSFDLLLQPNGRSAVGNYKAFLSLASYGDLVACAVSETNVGLCLTQKRGFSFGEAQSRFSDAELRYIYADAGFAFVELMRMSLCNEQTAVSRFAQYASIKTAYNRCRGRMAGESGVEIIRTVDGVSLSDPIFQIAVSGDLEQTSYAIVLKKQ